MKVGMAYFICDLFLHFIYIFRSSNISLLWFNDDKKREGKIIPSKFQVATFFKFFLILKKENQVFWSMFVYCYLFKLRMIYFISLQLLLPILLFDVRAKIFLNVTFLNSYQLISCALALSSTSWLRIAPCHNHNAKLQSCWSKGQVLHTCRLSLEYAQLALLRSCTTTLIRNQNLMLFQVLRVMSLSRTIKGLPYPKFEE